MFDDLSGGSQEFSGLLLGDGKKVKAWEKFVEDGLSPEFRQNIVNLNQRFILNEWAGSIATGTNKQKGNFGEIGADLDLNAKGYKSLQSRINDIESSGHNGIDIVVEKDGVYYIIEGKYIGSAKLNPANPRTGLPKQMTDDWIAQGNYQRLVEAVGQDLANRIIDKGYRRILAKTSKNGSVIYKELDLNAEIIGDWLP